MKELVEGALHKISPYLHDRGYALVTELDSAGIGVLVDPVRIEQVLRNLLENAARYSDPASTISVTVSSEDGNAVISIRDQGYGIVAYEQKRIFQAFYRGESSQRKGIRGAGLGLAICKGIVESHDGKLWVESNPNAGSTFRFTLPIVDGFVDEATDYEGLSASPDGGGTR